MTERDMKRIERAYWGPRPDSAWCAILWFMFIGLWLGFLTQMLVIASIAVRRVMVC